MPTTALLGYVFLLVASNLGRGHSRARLRERYTFDLSYRLCYMDLGREWIASSIELLNV
jgi:hypothetical protein